jgi:hypothetical protein
VLDVEGDGRRLPGRDLGRVGLEVGRRRAGEHQEARRAGGDAGDRAGRRADR